MADCVFFYRCHQLIKTTLNSLRLFARSVLGSLFFPIIAKAVLLSAIVRVCLGNQP